MYQTLHAGSILRNHVVRVRVRVRVRVYERIILKVFLTLALTLTLILGDYHLDLSDPFDRAVSFALLRLAAAHQTVTIR
jgi:hypothetical protein